MSQLCVGLGRLTCRNVRSKELWGLLENHSGQFPCFDIIYPVLFMLRTGM